MYTKIGTPIRSDSSQNSNAIPKNMLRFSPTGSFAVKKKHLLDTDGPYSALMGLLEPKPETVEKVIGPHEFMCRCKGIFDEESS